MDIVALAGWEVANPAAFQATCFHRSKGIGCGRTYCNSGVGCVLVVALISDWNAMHGRGPFGTSSLADHVLSLHILLTVFALPLMLTAALIAERRRGEETLHDTRSKLVHTQEQERHRIARELHDGIVQELTLLSVNLDQLRKESDPAMKLRLDGLYDQVTGAAETTRELSHDLHPFVLEYLGLARALCKLCRDAATQSHTSINVTEKSVPSHLTQDISHCLYRVAQEALQNIVKHSHARAAAVELNVPHGHVLPRIVDDGNGMSSEQLHSEGMGLTSMRERLLSLNGTFKITSAPLKGTIIEAVPIKVSP